eukprot:5899936-Pleurochrysis_carterae.AAC.2
MEHSCAKRVSLKRHCPQAYRVAGMTRPCESRQGSPVKEKGRLVMSSADLTVPHWRRSTSCGWQTSASTCGRSGEVSEARSGRRRTVYALKSPGKRRRTLTRTVRFIA